MTVQPPWSDNPVYLSYRASLDAFQRTLRELSQPATIAPIVPTSRGDRTGNELRPQRLVDVVGQAPAKKLIEAAIDAARHGAHPLDHMLFTGPSGTGKSTLAHVIGEELGVAVYQVAAPIAYDTLLEFREQMRDGDILFIDEIHLQAIQERRGKESITQPEVLYQVLEDHVLVTPRGPLPFPAITVIGATTDPGRLPEAFLKRFPLRPRLVPYTEADLAVIAIRNARALGMTITKRGAVGIARAAAGQPRIVNNLVRNARLFGSHLDEREVREVREANGIAKDGLDAQQQEMLRFMYDRCALTTNHGVVYQASLGSIAVALGLSRDTKAVQLYVEPVLVQRGYVQTTSQGRRLTDAGIQRATRVGR